MSCEETCHAHSGIEARLANCEKAVVDIEGDLEKMEHQINDTDRKFSQILVSIILVLVGVIANLGYMVLK